MLWFVFVFSVEVLVPGDDAYIDKMLEEESLKAMQEVTKNVSIVQTAFNDLAEITEQQSFLIGMKEKSIAIHRSRWMSYWMKGTV